MNHKSPTLYIVAFLLICAIPILLESKDKTAKNEIEFWQYWSGSEKKPLEDLVNKFNSQDHGFKVKMLSVSMPRKKILMAAAGGVPPDLVHLDGDMVVDFALRGALENLGISDLGLGNGDDFIPIYMEMLNIDAKQFAMPLMPTCDAMHVNKDLLAKHGLEIPQTLDDIVEAFDLIHDKEIAWLPTWPPWAGKFIVSAFGGNWHRANSPENIRAWTWVNENFAQKIPSKKLAAFTEGFKSYQSPDNPFYAGKIAIENNGVWEKRLAKIFAPKVEVEIAPFPSEGISDQGLGNGGTLVAVDALAVPRGAENKEEAEIFMRWLLKQENLEYLALAQGKFSPLKNYSDDFISKHPNPYIKTFIDLAKSPSASYFPQVKFANRYKREIKNHYTAMLRGEMSPEKALNDLQAKFFEP